MKENKLRTKYEKIFNTKIKESIWNSNPLDEKNFKCLEFLCLPTFTDYFLLQFYWNNQEAKWSQIIWEKEKDKELIELWFDLAISKNEIHPLELSFLKKEGNLDLKISKDIESEINLLNIKSFFLSNFWEKGKDGELRRIKISGDGNFICLEWQSSSTPTEWYELDKFVEKILTISKALI